MTKDKALKLALGYVKRNCPALVFNEIKEALAQPAQPVSWTGNGSAEQRDIEAPTGFFFQVDKRLEEDDDIQDYKKPWVGLTDDEKIFFSTWLDYKEDHEVFTAIEAKLKELNT